MEDKLNRMRSLVNQLNQASDVYYNGKGEILTDYEWDALFDQLKKLEEETGEILPDSPTNKVSEDTIVGQKEEHEFAALSGKDQEGQRPRQVGRRPPYLDFLEAGWPHLGSDIRQWQTHQGGNSRNGHKGTNITHLAPAISGIPQSITEKGHLVIRGEAVISYADFEQFIIEAKVITPIPQSCIRLSFFERCRRSQAAPHPMDSFHSGLLRTGNHIMGQKNAVVGTTGFSSGRAPEHRAANFR